MNSQLALNKPSPIGRAVTPVTWRPSHGGEVPIKKPATARSRQRQQTASVCIHYISTEARRVEIAASFNDWRPAATPMILLGVGHWAKRLMLPPGHYEYLLVADGRWIPDPNAVSQVTKASGSCVSVLVVPALSDSGRDDLPERCLESSGDHCSSPVTNQPS